MADVKPRSFLKLKFSENQIMNLKFLYCKKWADYVAVHQPSPINCHRSFELRREGNVIRPRDACSLEDLVAKVNLVERRLSSL